MVHCGEMIRKGWKHVLTFTIAKDELMVWGETKVGKKKMINDVEEEHSVCLKDVWVSFLKSLVTK